MIQAYIKKHLPIKFVNYLRRIKNVARFETDNNFQNNAEAFLEKEQELKIVTRLIKRDSICLDIGGNIGNFAYHLCKSCPDGLVISFEPRSDLFNRLKNNLKKFSNFKAHHLALSDKDCNLEISLDPSHGNSTVENVPSVAGLRREKIQGLSLDNFLENELYSNIDFIKIDVEGHEAKVLKGASKTVQKFRPIILCESENKHLLPLGTSVQEVLKHFMLDFKYNCFYYMNGNLHPYNERIVPASKMSKEYQYIYNWLLIPEEKVQQLPRFN